MRQAYSVRMGQQTMVAPAFEPELGCPIVLKYALEEGSETAVRAFARMPTSRNRDMGHPIFVVSIWNSMRDCVNVYQSMGAVLQASASKKFEGEEHGP